MKRCFFLLFLCVGFLGYVSSAHALTIAPLRQTAVVEAGEDMTISLFVINETDTPFVVTPEVDAFVIDEQTGVALFGQPDIAKQWVTPVEKRIALQPGEHGQFQFIVHPPVGTLPGAHYLGLFAKSSAGDGQVGVGSRVGSLFFLHVAGDVTELLVQKDFSFNTKSIWQRTRDVYIDISNEGNIHVVPTGKIVVHNWRGKTISEIPLNTKEEKILAGGRFKRTFSFPSLSIFDIGKVEATLHMQYGLTNQLFTRSISFWYVPLGSMVGVFILLGTFVGMVWFFKKRE
ncbi:MAG: hypothetical protein COU33_04090 [Candidatus Magasanikbacteria bacterium CG10_big_fil_rev_8_21_14_0_10_43_6]|uniref:Uncharacterized protein n=1 Tax=Candidatus Magasanikbacteria bacterium CG10_big_fil_rev_8_21_14_0_10_43_6 TaxID=1974650 RepID=A0A2M6W0E6_9BACT|nr:MAG: hypothetical protein COU33_04090 [Candidatus Magasanikbacteria bacterium CG10_big_fil_rev_8_21_14_0_10_43_6]